MQALTDEDLIARARLAPGSPAAAAALEELFQRHFRRVSIWCLRLTGDPDRAADLAQEVLTSAYRHLDSFQGNSKFSTWLYTICRNSNFNAWRSRATEPTGEGEDELSFLADPRDDQPMEDRLAREAQLELARRWIRESLDETERQVFTLHYTDEMPLDSITRILGLTNPSGAKAYIVSARRKLQESARRWRVRNENARGR
jgi:RNA polymerase sigma-70 factor (ECF subfamily)